MKKVAIIGLGWLGLPLAHYLANQGWQVTGTKRRATKIAGIEVFTFRLGEPYCNGFEKCLAVDSIVINIPPARFQQGDYFKAIKVLVQHAMLQQVRHVIFVSTTGVFPQESGIFDENCTTLLDSDTVQVERYLQTLPIACDIVRLAGLIGKQRHPVFHLAGKTALKNGGQPVNLVHQQDVIRGITLLLNQPNQQRIFHLCAPLHPTRETYYVAMAQRFNLPDLHFLADSHPLVRTIAGDKICRELGFCYQFNDPFLMPIDA